MSSNVGSDETTDMKAGERFTATPSSVYADALMQMGIGPFVSHLVLGRQAGPTTADPVVQITMPTNAMLSSAQHIVALFSDPAVAHKAGLAYTEFQQSVEQLLT